MVECKRCYAFASGSQDLESGILKHIEKIPETMKCSQKEYSKRLSQCEKCDKLQNGMCGYCGCFVILRAIKKNQYCPYPKTPKW